MKTVRNTPEKFMVLMFSLRFIGVLLCLGLQLQFSFAQSDDVNPVVLPFTEYFNDESIPVSWTQQFGGDITSNGWGISYSNDCGGDPNEAWTNYTFGVGWTRLVSPLIDPEGTQEIVLQFKTLFIDYSQGITLSVETSSDGVDWSPENWSLSSGNGDFGPATVTINLENNTSGPFYISFTMEGDFYMFYYWAIDNVEVHALQAPVCADNPFPPDAASNADLPLNIHWSPVGEASGYYLYFGTNNPPDNILNGVDVGTDNHYLITAALPQTNYYWQVIPYNVMGSGTSCPIWSFTTTSLVTPPFSENFDNPGWPQGWQQWTSNTSAYWAIENTNYAGGLPNEMYGNFGSGTGSSRLILPAFDVTSVSSLSLGFYYTFWDYAPGMSFKIQSSSDGNTWTDESWSFVSGSGSLGPDSVLISIENNLGGTLYLSFLMEGDFWVFYHWILDNISVFTPALPSCSNLVQPMDGATNVPLVTNLEWQAVPGADGYLLLAGTDQPPGNIADSIDLGLLTTYNLPTLMFGEIVHWKIVPYNSTGFSSSCPEWSFSTVPSPVTYSIPFEENFNSILIPDNWQTIQTPGFSGQVWNLHTYSEAGGQPNEMRATLTYGTGTSRLITPALNTMGYSELYLSFRHFFNDYSNGLIAKIQTSSNGLDWTDVGFTINSGNGDRGPEVVNIPITTNLGGITFISFTLVGDHYTFLSWNIDEVMVTSLSNPPICSNLINPPNGANDLYLDVNLDWDGVPMANGYRLFVGTDNPPTNLMNGQDMLNATSFLLNGLQMNTTYYWRVAPYNSLGQTDSCAIYSFTTFGPSSLPFSEYFNEEDLPSGWLREGGGVISSWSISLSTGACGEANEAKFMNYNEDSLARLISPPLQTIGLNYIKLHFKTRLIDIGSGGIVKVQSSNDGVNWNDESWWLATDGKINECEIVNMVIQVTSGNYTWIAFTVTGNLGAVYSWSVDDIQIDVLSDIPECVTSSFDPYNGENDLPLVSGLELSWGGVENSAAYRLYLGTDNPPTNLYNGYNVGPHSFFYPQGLVLGVTYYWKIIPYNPLGEASSCPVKSFSTIPSQILPYLEDFSGSINIPAGWAQTYPSYLPIWNINTNTPLAGGQAYEIIFLDNFWEGTTRLITPPINTSNSPDSILLSFKQYYMGLSTGSSIKVETSSDGIMWTEQGWNINSETGIHGPEEIQLKITHNLGGTTYIAFTVTGEFHTSHEWALDDINVYDPGSIPCPPIVYPESLDTAVPTQTVLSWNQTPSTEGYLLSLGTVNPYGIILQNTNVGDTSQFPYCCFSYGTDYWWMIRSYNSTDTNNCDTVYFRTKADPIQQLPYKQYFPNEDWPFGWTLDQGPEGYIYLDATNEAGGEAWEVNFLYSWDHLLDTIRLISPPFNTTGMTKLNLDFLHFLDMFQDSILIKIQSSSDGIHWADESWSNLITSNIGPEEVLTSVVHNLGDRTWIAWVIQGDLFNYDFWYVDNIKVSEAKPHDVGVYKLQTPVFIEANQPDQPTILVRNFGLNPENFSVTLEISDGYTATTNVNNLLSGQVQEVSFSDWTPLPDSYTCKAYTQLATDMDHQNDTLYSDTIIASLAWWHQGDSIIEPAYNGSACSFEPDENTNWIFATGGGILKDKVQVFDANTEQWAMYDTLPAPRIVHASAILGDYLYIIGGQSFINTINSTVFRLHIPSHIWDTVSSLPIPLEWTKAASFQDSLIYVVAGHTTGKTVSGIVLLYNANEDTWRLATSLPYPRFGGALAITGNTLVYSCGFDGNTDRSTTFIGTINLNKHDSISWKTGTDHPEGTHFRFDGASWRGDQVIFAAGGENTQWVPRNPSPCYLYNPYTDAWEQRPYLPVPVIGPALASLSMGVTQYGNDTWELVAGSGYDGSAIYPGTQIFKEGLGGNSANLHGLLSYDNASHTPLINTNVELLLGLVSQEQTLTDNNGIYNFYNLSPGSYNLKTYITKPWGGGNAVDALLIMKHFVNMNPLTGLRLIAADVNMSNSVNAQDGLMVMKRFVGMQNSFNSGDWCSENPGFTANPGDDLTINFKGLCFGDVDASYILSAKNTSVLELDFQNVIRFKPGKLFELPVIAKAHSDIASLSLILEYDPSSIEILSVNTTFSPDNLVYEAREGELRLAWYCLTPYQVNADCPLFVVQMEVNKNCPLQAFSISATEASSVTDVEGLTLQPATLIIPNLMMEGSELQFYPNPVSGRAQLIFYLDKESNVRLNGMDMAGKIIFCSDLGLMKAGHHSEEIDLKNLSEGMYFLELRTENQTIIPHNKLKIIKQP